MRRLGLCVLILAVLCILPAAAEEDKAAEVAKDFAALEDLLPEDIASLLPSGFFSEDALESANGVREASRFSYFLGVVGDIIGFHLGDALSLFASLLGLLLMGALFERVRVLFRSDMLRSATALAVSVAILACVISLQYRFLNGVMDFFDRLTLLVNGMIPLTSVLYAMGGNVTTAVVGNAGLMMFLNLCENFCAAALRSAFSICTALAVCAAFTPSFSFTGITNLVKRVYTFSLGFLMLLLSFSLSVQTSLASASDSVAMRGAKMLAGSAIPVVGGSVGDTLKTVAGSVGFLKSTVGIGGIVLVCLLVLPTFLSVLLYRLSLISAAACADFLGCARESRLLSGLVTVYGYLLASVAICSVTFIFLLTLFVRCGVAVG